MAATIEAHRWKREEYERLAAQGFFPPGQRVILREGDRVSPLSQPEAAIAVAELLP
jgi:hypothetical protein